VSKFSDLDWALSVHVRSQLSEVTNLSSGVQNVIKSQTFLMVNFGLEAIATSDC
jgi:hypothetical protein